MFVLVIEFENGDLVIPHLDEKKAKRLYSLVQIIFPSLGVKVFELRRVM